jgi:hypothetical protein
MKNITKKTLDEIEKRFKVNGIYITSKEDPYYCPQVNGLTNICLFELGFKAKAKDNTKSLLQSSAFDKREGLFYRETDLEGNPRVRAFNSCKNSIAALSLSVNGFTKEANAIINKLLKSKVYDSKKGLFRREYDSKTGEVNPLILTQSNLWAVLALISLGRTKEAKEIMNSIENASYDPKLGLFISQDCRFQESPKVYFVDDQALAAISYFNLKEKKKAEELIERTLETKLFDEKTSLFNRNFSSNSVDLIKSTYKNSLMAFALAKTGHKKDFQALQKSLIEYLFDEKTSLFNQTSKDRTHVPDNSILALLVLDYISSNQEVF